MNSEMTYQNPERVLIKNDLPFYEEILDFFHKITQVKKLCKDELERAIEPLRLDEALIVAKTKNGFPLLDKEALPLEYPVLKNYFLNLLEIAGSRVQDETDRISAALSSGEMVFEEALRDVIKEEGLYARQELLTFLLSETIKPLLEVYAGEFKDRLKHVSWSWGYCPVCGGDPFLGVVRHEQGTRYLVCAACATEWIFPRVKCPFCETTNHDSLWYYMASGDERCRVEICEECKHYIKTIDQRKLAHQESLLVQNIKTLHLDMVVGEKGYIGKVFVI